jgi:mannosyl-oligosaccharide alpha-1,3-glucosidase
MRPLLTQYPLDESCFTLENEYMLSDKLLVRPVMQKNVSTVDVYFPSKDGGWKGDIWYDIDDYRKYKKVGFESIRVNQSKIPVYQRGGTIIPKKETIRSASTFMRDDPYTLIVAVDGEKYAKGTLYMDDEKSFEYRKGKYLYIEFEFKDGVLSSR